MSSIQLSYDLSGRLLHTRPATRVINGEQKSGVILRVYVGPGNGMGDGGSTFGPDLVFFGERGGIYTVFAPYEAVVRGFGIGEGFLHKEVDFSNHPIQPAVFVVLSPAHRALFQAMRRPDDGVFVATVLSYMPGEARTFEWERNRSDGTEREGEGGEEGGGEIGNGFEDDPEDKTDLGVFNPNNTASALPSVPKKLPFTPIPIEPPEGVDPDSVRIGYAYLTVPIETIESSIRSRVAAQGGVRMGGTVKKHLGLSYESYTMSWVATSPEDVLFSVKNVMDQVTICPFLSVDGGPFEARPETRETQSIPYDAIAVRSVTLSTVPGEPGAIKVDLEFDPFLWWMYSPIHNDHEHPVYEYGDMICWPLYKLWGSTRNNSKFDLSSYPNGVLRFSFPTKDLAAKFAELLDSPADAAGDPFEERAALDTIERLVKYDTPVSVASRRAKRLVARAYTGQGTWESVLYVVYKTARESIWNYYVDPRSPGHKYYAGLVKWGKIESANYVDEDGRLLPYSGNLDPDLVTPSISKSGTIRDHVALHEPLPLLDVIRGEDIPAINQPWKEYALVLKVGSADSSRSEFLEGVKYHREQLLNESSAPVNEAKEILLEEWHADIDADSVYDLSNHSGITVTNINVARAHNLAVMSNRLYPYPTHQYLGSFDGIVTIDGVCHGSEARLYLKSMKEEFDKRILEKLKPGITYIDESDVEKEKSGVPSPPPNSNEAVEAAEQLRNKVNKRDSLFTGFLRIENEIAQLADIDFVVPISLEFATESHEPDVWRFSMVLLEFDPKGRLQEEIRFLESNFNTLGRVLRTGFVDEGSERIATVEKAMEYFQILAEMGKFELYPDMDLPTVGEFNTWIGAIVKAAYNFVSKDGDVFRLTPYERDIVSRVEPMIRANAETIVKKWTLPSPSQLGDVGGLVGQRVDPDFYCWYPQDLSFHADMHRILRYTFGKRNPDNTAEGSIELTETGLRFQDTNSPLIMLGTPKQKAAVADALRESEAWFSTPGDGLFGPPNVEDYVAAMREAGDKMRDTPGFWKSLVGDGTVPISFPTDSKFIDLGLEAEDRFIKEDIFLPQFERPSIVRQGDKQVVAGTIVDKILESMEGGTDNLKDMFLREALQMFTYRYRQQVLLSALARTAQLFSGGQFPGREPRVGVGTFQDNPASPVFYLLGGNQDRIYVTDMNDVRAIWEAVLKMSPDNLTEDAIRKLIWSVVPDAVWASELGLTGSNREAIQFTETLLTSVARGFAEMFRAIGDLLTTGGLPPVPGSIFRTSIRATAYYHFRRVSTEVPDTPRSIGNLSQGADRKYFDFICAKNGVDPNLVRAFLVVRSGIGRRITREGGRNVADIPTSNPLYRENDVEQIKVIVEKLGEWQREFGGLPTPALIMLHQACRMEGRHGFDDYLEKLKDYLYENGVSRAGAFRYYKVYRETLSRIINELGLIDVFNLYISAYIEQCRKVGSILVGVGPDPSGADGIFDPVGPLVVLSSTDQIADDFVLGTDYYFPNSNTVTIIRSSIAPDSNTAAEEAFSIDAENLDAESLALMAKSYQAALDPFSDNAIYGAVHDLLKYGPFGRMLGAYPTVMVLIISPGGWIYGGEKRLWDHYYARSGIVSVEVFRSRFVPASTCDIVFSNMFYNLTAYGQMEVFLQKLFERVHKVLPETLASPTKLLQMVISRVITKDDPELVAKWMNNHLRRIVLEPGARLHVRMGYGSQAVRLPVVFNGTIAAVEPGEGLVMVSAVGDGAELMKEMTKNVYNVEGGFAYSQGGFFGTGQDPSNLLVEAMASQGLGAVITQGRFFRDFSSSLANFGDVLFTGTFPPSYSAAELQINIYSPKRSRIEQGISGIARYLNFNGLYDWGRDDLLFSLQVKEPTIWKLAEVCRLACLDFATGVEPFAFRSTLFFGRPWYPLHYTYDPRILRLLPRTVAADLGTPAPRMVVVPPSVIRQYLGWADRIGRPEDAQLLPVPDGSARFINQVGTTLFGSQLSTLLDSYVAQLDIDPLFSGSVAVNKLIEEMNRYNQEQSQNVGAQLTFESLESIAITPRLSWSPSATIEYAFSFRNGATITVAVTGGRAFSLYHQTARRRRYVVPGLHPSQDILLHVKGLVAFLKWKPYMQCYFATSAINLLDMSIRADSAGVYTDAIGIHTYNGIASRDTIKHVHVYSVDTDIHPAVRRTMLVDTGLLVTTTQSLRLGKKVGEYLPFIGRRLQETPDTPAVENGVVAALVDSVKNMYKGWFTIRGLASIKPRDLIQLADHRTMVRGPVQVREVVHRMDSEVGFITMITPDAIAFPHSSVVGMNLIMGLSNLMSRYYGYAATKFTAAFLWGLFFYKGALMKRVSIGMSRNLVEEAVEIIKGKLGNVSMAELRADVHDTFIRLLSRNKNFGRKIRSMTEAQRAAFYLQIKPDDMRDLIDRAVWQALGGVGKKLADAGASLELTGTEQRLFSAYLGLLEELDLMDTASQGIVGAARRREFLERLQARLYSRLVTDHIDDIVTVLRTSDRWKDAAEGLKLGGKTFREIVSRYMRMSIRKHGMRAFEKVDQEILNRLVATIGSRENINRSAIAAIVTKINDEMGQILAKTGGRLPRAFNLGIAVVSEPIAAAMRGISVILGAGISGAKWLYGKRAAFAPTGRQVIDNAAKVLKTGQTKEVVDGAKAAVKGVGRGAAALRGALRILGLSNPIGWLFLGIDFTIFGLFGALAESFETRLKARQCVSILPLAMGKYPWTAGLRGHMGAVVGDDPGWGDRLIMDIFNPSHPVGWALGLALALYDVEIPEYADTELSRRWDLFIEGSVGAPQAHVEIKPPPITGEGRVVERR